MSHPDSAWSSIYYGPQGLENEPCAHSKVWAKIGPTGRKTFMIHVYQCGKCGRILRSAGTRWATNEPIHLTWQEYSWIRRYNRLKT